MRTLPVVFVLLFPFFALAEDSEQGVAKHDDAIPVNRLGNEVRLPDPDGWHRTGACEVQLTPSSERIAKTDKSLPVTVWFRNPTEKLAAVRCIAGHSFNPHGRLRVTGPKGKEILGGECLKKHAMQQILLNPGQVRGFICDAFSQCCYRKPAGDLTPGRYLLEFMGAKSSVELGTLNVQIPAGLVTATVAQKEFIAKVQTLSRGMPLQAAKRHLGVPPQERSGSLFYHLIEDRLEGGYYVTATLTFDDSGLADVKVGFGHESRSPRIEE